MFSDVKGCVGHFPAIWKFAKKFNVPPTKFFIEQKVSI